MHRPANRLDNQPIVSLEPGTSTCSFPTNHGNKTTESKSLPHQPEPLPPPKQEYRTWTNYCRPGNWTSVPKNWPISYPNEKRTAGQCGKVYQEYFPQSSAGGSVTTNTVGWMRYALAKDPTFVVSRFFSFGGRTCAMCVLCIVMLFCMLCSERPTNPESKSNLDKTTESDAVCPSLPPYVPYTLTLLPAFAPLLLRSFHVPHPTLPLPRVFPFQRSPPLASIVVQTPTNWNVSSTKQATLDPRNAAS